MIWTWIIWALGVGFLQGFLHCAGMCGPFVMAYSLSTVSNNPNIRSLLSHLWTKHIPYNLGRVLAFTLFGMLFGIVGSFIDSVARLRGMQTAAAFLGGGLMICWAIDEYRTHHAGAFLERLSIMRLPVIKRAFAHLSRQNHTIASLLSGFILGMHPCGLLFAMLFSAAATGSGLHGGMILFAFGIGTIPSLLAVAMMGWYGRKRLKGLVYTYIATGLIGLSGFLFIMRGLASNGWIPKVNMWLF